MWPLRIDPKSCPCAAGSPFEHSMKPILRNLRSGLYFQGCANWTQHAEDALVYRSIESALEAAISSNMPALELNVLLFDDPRYTLRLPLDHFFDPQAHSRTNFSLLHSSGKTTFAQPRLRTFDC